MTGGKGESPVFTIQGREVGFPVVVSEASSGVVMFAVPTARARDWLPGSELVPLEVFPGKSVLSIAAIDYKQNDLGDYNEVSIALFVRRRGEGGRLPYLSDAMGLLGGKAATYIKYLPVDQPFTCEAGCAMWGFPKSVERIEIRYEESRAVCSLEMDGQHVLTCEYPRGGKGSLPEMSMQTFTYIEGALHRTPYRSAATGVGKFLRGARISLGDHPIAQELRSLGLPKRPMASAWMEKLNAQFDPAQKV